MALVEGTPRVVPATRIAGHPVRIPVLDIETVGAGGGSIARIDAGGALAVGPESAGAVPGPVCYARGGREVTVTDANLYLGRIHPPSFLGGRMELDVAASRAAVEDLARRAGLRPAELAEGVSRVAVSHMARAVRRVSVERGEDPARFALVAFGGAGPLHAVELARELGVRTVVVPRDPGIFSALGMAYADVVLDRARAALVHGDEASPAAIRELAGPLEDEVRDALIEEGFARDRTRIATTLDVRYTGQSHEIEVPLGARFRRAFDEEHERLHGHGHPGRAIEVVAIRVRGTGRVRRPGLPSLPGGGTARSARIGTADAPGGQPVPVYDRGRLGAGARIRGPATLVEETATTFVPAGATARVEELGHLGITVGGAR